jgi:hypothetical protein
MAARDPFFAIKTREMTRTENGTLFSYTKNDRASNKTRIETFQARMITSPDDFTEPGFYTWIMKEGKSGPPKLYALRTLSMQEIGTLHSNLNLYSNDPNPIIAAGELQVIAPNSINFNLLSGTYMVPIFKRFDNKESKKMELINKFIGLFEGSGKKVEFLNCDTILCSDEEKSGGKKLIEGANIRTSSQNLNFLNTLFSRKVSGGKTRRKRTRKVYRHKRKTRKHKSNKAIKQ